MVDAFFEHHGIDIPGFIRKMAARNFHGAYDTITESNPNVALFAQDEWRLAPTFTVIVELPPAEMAKNIAGYRAEGGISFLRTIKRRFWLNFLSIDHPSVGSRLRTVAFAVDRDARPRQAVTIGGDGLQRLAVEHQFRSRGRVAFHVQHAQLAVHFVVMDVSAVSSASRGNPLGKHFQNRVVGIAR